MQGWLVEDYYFTFEGLGFVSGKESVLVELVDVRMEQQNC
jgi:hypothetical protein